MLISRRWRVCIEFFFSRIVKKRQKKRVSNLMKISEEIDQIKEEYASKGNNCQYKVFTEKDLIYYLYLNPVGTIEDDEIMQSAIAKNYFDIGLIKQGVGDGMTSQYYLTAFGRDQVKKALIKER